jgi:predicted dehydrogenase
LENKPSKVGGEEGLKDLLAIEAIYKSIETRASVNVQTA